MEVEKHILHQLLSPILAILDINPLKSLGYIRGSAVDASLSNISRRFSEKAE